MRFLDFFFPKFSLVKNSGNKESRLHPPADKNRDASVLAKWQRIVKPCILVNLQLPITGLSDSPNSLSCAAEDNASRRRGLFWL